jgi:triacylglycerol esterase/lipase EstA (alpha/beta hydrolase family)
MNFTRVTRPATLRLVVAAVVVAIAGLVIPLSQIASARTVEAAGAGDGPKPSIVLVHGAWADSGSWDGVAQRLQAHGYTVYALPNVVTWPESSMQQLFDLRVPRHDGVKEAE